MYKHDNGMIFQLERVNKFYGFFQSIFWGHFKIFILQGSTAPSTWTWKDIGCRKNKAGTGNGSEGGKARMTSWCMDIPRPAESKNLVLWAR